MAEVDTPFKQLVGEFSKPFAAWLLGMDEAQIGYVQSSSIELPADATRPDLLLGVTFVDGSTAFLHIEFQGRRSPRPMPLRMLDYIARLAQRESRDLCSAVIYVGEGAGVDDPGEHQICCPGGGVTLTWRYRVIRLWEMRAEELLTLGHPALLPLIGQTRLENPTIILPHVLDTLQKVSDETQRTRLFRALLGLMKDEEVLMMTERLLASMEVDELTDTALWRRMRAEAYRQNIMDVLLLRFDPHMSQIEYVASKLAKITDPTRLRLLHQMAVRIEDMTAFERALATNGDE